MNKVARDIRNFVRQGSLFVVRTPDSGDGRDNSGKASQVVTLYADEMAARHFIEIGVEVTEHKRPFTHQKPTYHESRGNVINFDEKRLKYTVVIGQEGTIRSGTLLHHFRNMNELVETLVKAQEAERPGVAKV